MITLKPPTPSASSSEVEGYLSAIGQQVFEQAAPLLPKQPTSAEPLHLQRLHVSPWARRFVRACMR